MDKRKVVICVIIIILGPIFFILSVMNNRDSNKKEISDYKKWEKVEEFVGKEKGTDPNRDIETNEGGYSGIFIKNKQELLKVMNTDGMMSVDNMLNEAFEYIPEVHEDSKSLRAEDINGYYEKHKDNINNIFGISDKETFAILLSDLNFIGEGKINEAIIEKGSIKKGEFKEGEVRFTLTLKSTIGKEGTFNIKFLIQENNQKNSRLIYWY